KIHGENSHHDTSECIQLRKDFALYYPQFMEYMGHTRGGRGAGRGLGDPYRQQSRLDSGGDWSRGRPPPLPPRAQPGRHPGGRG
ncbi:unnamed protein product, partial [Pylaiella littoralis]